MGPKSQHLCGQCSKACTTGTVQCSSCDRWFHKACCGTSMTEEMFKLIVTIAETGGSHCWNCPGCDCAYKKLNKRILNLEKRQDATDAVVAQHTGQLEAHDGKFQEVEKALKDISKENSKEKTVEATTSSVFQELNDREQRKDNLIVHQLPEPADSVKDGVNRKKMDEETLRDVLAELKVKINQDEDIKFCVRLGETRDDLETKPRPILIGFRNLDARNRILQASRNLAKSKYKSISIIPDLTKRQRQEETEMRKEVETNNGNLTAEEALNWEWKMVGTRGQRKVIKAKKRPEVDSRKRPRSTHGDDSPTGPLTRYQKQN